jgi:hypothetical protein
MDREEVIGIIREAVEASVRRAGAFGIPVLSESGEQVAIDVIDALEGAGFTIERSVEPRP